MCIRDRSGIIRIGAYVKPSDILVGKVTPKGETQLTPEEKLLRAIFGEKAGDVRDASLLCPPGIEGIVVGVKIFSRKGIEKDDRALEIETEELEMLEKNLEDEIRILHEEVKKRVATMLEGQVLGSDLFDDAGRETLLGKGAELTEEVVRDLPYQAVTRIRLSRKNQKLESALRLLGDRTERQIEVIRQMFEEKKEKIRRGDELPPGVIKLVKVYVAMKRKLSVGDKMAGRHGNKGVISKIVPIEDMPYLENGQPVDVVLNPLGVPSRMNVGQILETHLGWASAGLGQQIGDMLDQVVNDGKLIKLRDELKTLYGKAVFDDDINGLVDEEILELVGNLRCGVPMATPVFDGAREDDINEMLDRAGLDTSGQVSLYDGRSGEMFDRKITVGYIYMMKLHHLVDDKIHARSILSLIHIPSPRDLSTSRMPSSA